ncbi:Sybindin-like protein [Tothia fuscella]|uniref:Trafficking protein particle complex subunit n=1 Tax=Tothia fuscella TaxID=1048955 RepID=A0A9P4P405_9PEZI|nr:Sybindin-like protein [Tothia fuscella]
MVVFALLIINKAGGLVYNREFHTGLAKLSSNDLLILAGTFHGVHAITRSLIPSSLKPISNPGTPQNFPQRPSGLEVLESSHFRLTCFQTLTGTKFLLFTEPAQPNVDSVIKRIYELYTDFVMKNPFYTVEMPIRCQKFDAGLDAFVRVKS